MNILIATQEAHNFNIVTDRLSSVATIDLVEDVKQLFNALESRSYNYIIADFYLGNIDIFRLANLIRKYQYVILSDISNIYHSIPPLLAKEHSLYLTNQEEIAQIIISKQSIKNIVKPSVLVIEDDNDSIEVVQMALRGMYDVDSSSNGRDGLEKWKIKRHDIVLLDMMMPEMLGTEVLEKICDIEPRQPVVMVTGYGNKEFQHSFFINGASDILSKPFKQSDLREICQRVHRQASAYYLNEYYLEKMTQISQRIALAEQAISNNELGNALHELKSAQQCIGNGTPSEEEIFINL